MTNEDLQERIENSPALSKVRDQLTQAIGVRAGSGYEFDPLLVISIISVIVQVVIYCREKRKPSEVRVDMRELRNLPAWQKVRLHRKLNALWRKHGGAKYIPVSNPLIDAVYDVSASADDEMLDAMLWLGDKNDQPEN